MEEQLLKFMTQFKDIPTYLWLYDYRDDSLITLYLVLIGISISKIRYIA